MAIFVLPFTEPKILAVNGKTKISKVLEVRMFYKKYIVVRDEFGRVKYVKSPVVSALFIPCKNDSKIKLVADKKPTGHNASGIYCVTNKNARELKTYCGEICEIIPVKNSTIVLHERGARIENAILHRINDEDYFVRTYESFDEFLESEFGINRTTGDVDFDKLSNIPIIINEQPKIFFGERQVENLGNIGILAELKATHPKIKEIKFERDSLILYLNDIAIGILNARNELFRNARNISNIHKWNKLTLAELLKEIGIKYIENQDVDKFTFYRVFGMYHIIYKSSEKVSDVFHDKIIDGDTVRSVIEQYLLEVTGAKMKGFLAGLGIENKVKHFVINDIECIIDEEKFANFSSYVIRQRVFSWSKVETSLIKDLEVLIKTKIIEASKYGNYIKFIKHDRNVSKNILTNLERRKV